MSLKNLVKEGQNKLSVEITSIWFNRLVFDASQSEEKCKTWTINGLDENILFWVSRLLGIEERKMGE